MLSLAKHCLKAKCALSLKHLAAAFFALFLLIPAIVSPASAAENPKVVASMKDLKAELAKLGEAKLDGDNLFFGATKINDDYAIVDGIKTKHEGTATVFAKKGANFVRVTTNVMKDGKRAVGSILDPSDPAYAALSKGEAYYGLVDILGKMYDTGYEPIKNAAGEVIGVAYVGYLME